MSLPAFAKVATQFLPSPQQQAVFDWTMNGSGSAFVEAVAGAGKTTTLIELCKLLKGSVVFVAFNKKIVDEIKARLLTAGLSQIDAATFHSLGFKAWRKVYPGVKVDDRAKQRRLIDEVRIPDAFEGFVFKAVAQAKNRAMFEKDIDNTELWWDIVNHFDLVEELEDGIEDAVTRGIEYAKQTLRQSIKISNELINFDDMIYMPVIKGVKVWQYNWLLTDEAQDTNPVRRAFARKLLREDGRSVWVGDRAQSIYGFAGADVEAVDAIISEFNCKQLPLTVSYRCPKAVVAKARSLGSEFNITAHASAPDGIVDSLNGIKDMIAKGLTKDDAILCRKTAPLVSLAFYLIKKGTACHVEGKDIGAGLIKLVNHYKSAPTLRILLNRLKDYRDRETQKLIAKGRETQAEALADRIQTLFILAEGCDTVDCVKAKIIDLFQDSEGNKKPTLTLSTVHRSKGREWLRVFILGYSEYMPSKAARQEWQKTQEKFLQYVAITRSKSELYTVRDDISKKQGEEA